MGRYHLTGTWIDREGCPQTLYNADIQLAPLDTAVIDGRHIPTRWPQRQTLSANAASV